MLQDNSLEIMKNDTLGFNDESNRIAVPRCDLDDCSIRVLYLCTSNTAKLLSYVLVPIYITLWAHSLLQGLLHI